MAPEKLPALKKADHHPLKRWRFEYDLSLKELAAMLNPPGAVAYLFQVEHRQVIPSRDYALRICKVTGLKLADFETKAPGWRSR